MEKLQGGASADGLIAWSALPSFWNRAGSTSSSNLALGPFTLASARTR
jgi:hypothetical protein